MHSRLARWSSAPAALITALGLILLPVSAQSAGSPVGVAGDTISAADAITDVPVGEVPTPESVPAEALPDGLEIGHEEVAIVDGEGDLRRKTVDPFRMVGVTWAPDPEVSDVTVKVQVRVDGKWGKWIELEPGDDDFGGRPGTEPLWVDEGLADGVAVDVVAETGNPTDVQVSTINPDADSETTAAPASNTDAVETSSKFAVHSLEGAASMLSTGANTSLPMPNVITRAQWGAGPGTKCSAPTTQPRALGVTVHHSAGSNTAKKADSASIVKSYQAYHVGSHGWCDIGYNFLVDRWGQVFEGRKGGMLLQVRGAHAGIGAVNQWSTGISMMGNFDVAEPPAAMKDAIVRLTAWRMAYFDINPKGTYVAGGKTYQTLNGHRNVVSTACPGRYAYSWINAPGGMRDQVAALMADGGSAPDVAPDMPSGLAVDSATHNRATIKWNAVPDAARYRVVWRPDPAEGSATVTLVDNPEIELTGLSESSDYVIGVSSVSSGGATSSRTPLLNFSTPRKATPPVMPTGVKTTAVTDSSATIAWSAVPGAVKYRIVWRTDPKGKATISFVDSPQVTLSGLAASTDHVIGISAVNAADETSARTPLHKFTTTKKMTPPAMPTGVKTTAVTGSSATIAWNAVAGAVKYRIVWRTDPKGTATVSFVNSPQVTLTGLKASTDHVIGISAVNAADQTSARTPLHKFKTGKAAAASTPAMPTGVKTVSVTGSSATISWNAVPNAVKYRVVWRTDPTGTATATYVTSPQVTLTGLKASTNHVVGVSAVNAADKRSARTPLHKFKTGKAAAATPPAMPTGLKTTARSDSAATIAWNAVPGAVKYRVVWRPDPHPKATVLFVDSPQITLSGLEASSNYVVAVSAVNAADKTSTRSPLHSFRTDAPQPPAMPTGVTASSITASSITWTWPAVPGAVKYRIVWRAEDASSANIEFVNDPQAVLDGLAPATNYVFAVSAVNAAGLTSTRTGLHTASTKSAGPPAMPSGLKATSVSATAATISWNAVAGATQYRVVWRPDPAKGSAPVVFVDKPQIQLDGLSASSDYVIGVSAVASDGQTSSRTPLLKFKTTGAKASFKDSVKVPSNRVIKFKGHGFGHGIGMSQYGAQGGALLGYKYDAILAHYYRGTALANKSGNIRVQISADNDSEAKIVAKSGLKYRTLSDNTVVNLPEKIDGVTVSHWRIIPRSSNKKQSTIQHKAGSWKSWKHVSGDSQFEGPSTITLLLPNGTKRTFRGAIRSVATSAGSTKRHTVNVLSIEDYTKGVITREMPASWHTEALKAQAVAARTYGVRAIDSKKVYDICDTTSCQVYGGYDAETPTGVTAVNGTKGKILTYDGKPAFTQFSSSSGGWTNKGSQPYLSPVRDDWDNHKGNGVHNWTLDVSASKIEKAYPKIGTLKQIKVTKRNGYGDAGGRVVSVSLIGSKATQSITGVDARWAFGMRSDWFGF